MIIAPLFLLINSQLNDNIKKSIHEQIFHVNIKQQLSTLFLYLIPLSGCIIAFGESSSSKTRFKPDKSQPGQAGKVTSELKFEVN